MEFKDMTIDELIHFKDSSYIPLLNELANEHLERRRAIRDMYLDFAEELDAIRNS